MTSLQNRLLADGEDPEPSRRAISQQKQDRQHKKRQQREARAQQATRPDEGRPPEVSEKVWRLTQQWLDLGEKRLGHRPRVKKAKFAILLSEKFNDNSNPLIMQAKKQFLTGEYFALMADWMIRTFWDELEPHEEGRVHQLLFCVDYWDHYLERGLRFAEIQRWKDRGSPTIKYEPVINTAYHELLKEQQVARYVRTQQESENKPPLRTGTTLRKPRKRNTDGA